MSDNEQENENRETVADVVAEMLERADAMQTHGTTHGVRLAIREFARRINAAYNRERAKVEADALAVGGIVEAARRREETAEKSSAVGNAAAMLGAMLAIRDINDRRPHDADGYEINDIINDALSAPARNCDIYKNKKDAEAAFISEECKHPCGNCTINDEYGCALIHECGVDWLFAPAATERKGEADGR